MSSGFHWKTSGVLVEVWKSPVSVVFALGLTTGGSRAEITAPRRPRWPSCPGLCLYVRRSRLRTPSAAPPGLAAPPAGAPGEALACSSAGGRGKGSCRWRRCWSASWGTKQQQLNRFIHTTGKVSLQTGGRAWEGFHDEEHDSSTWKKLRFMDFISIWGMILCYILGQSFPWCFGRCKQEVDDSVGCGLHLEPVFYSISVYAESTCLH